MTKLGKSCMYKCKCELLNNYIYSGLKVLQKGKIFNTSGSLVDQHKYMTFTSEQLVSGLHFNSIQLKVTVTLLQMQSVAYRHDLHLGIFYVDVK